MPWGCAAGSKPVHIGYFDTQPEAARAYDKEAIRLRGPNTALNYPISDYDVRRPDGQFGGCTYSVCHRHRPEGTMHTVPYCSNSSATWQ